MATTKTRRSAASADAETLGRRYFEALAVRDVEAAVACWAPGGRDVVHGMLDVEAPEGVREFLRSVFAAMPDARFEIAGTTTEDDRCAVRWRLTGTFAGEPFQGIAATGARINLVGCDVVTVRDGLIVANDAYMDGMTFARQSGALPPAGSRQEAGMQAAVNARTRLLRRIATSGPEAIADGVWIVRGGFPSKEMNVYLVRDGDGVLVFDAGIKSMAKGVAAAGAQLGGVTRVVLGHSHADHRGVAPALGVPVYCHPAERADAEGDGGAHYFDTSKLDLHGRVLLSRLLPIWDGGPVEIAGTVAEGDDVAGFKVIDLPGHAPGLIGLWRESDRLALVSDCFYTLDPQTGRRSHPPHPRVPHEAFNFDTEQARASIRKLAALEPATAWPGHAEPLTGDVRAQLEVAAQTT
jgi:glyoxylase-like metal-dependent hydrolase (beta-lactamase superfamily II)/predicted ester cyclase